jgi:DNA-binding response OmpR family regulator
VKRILLMDDSAIFLDVMRAALEKEGYAVVCASTLSELDEVRSRMPCDLVLMDVQMPEAFGDDIAMTLRHAYGVQAPIHLLSSLDETELAERARWAEIDGYISKNRGMDAVISAVRGILQP